MSKILVVGGTGLLGSELKRIDNSLLCTGSEYDIFTFEKMLKLLTDYDPDIIINCAAILSLNVNANPIQALNVNVIGTANLAKYCIEKDKRLVYISTDYVYPGMTGNYKETDAVLPYNEYAWTKLAGEGATKVVNNHLIIRTSFGSTVFPYKEAYDNLYTSRDYVDIISPMILKAAKSDVTGILNIGTERKSVAEYANRRNNIKISSIKENKDFSFDTTKYDSIFTE